MPARKHLSIGEPAHDAERQAIRFLVEGLDENYVVYSNPWIVAANGATYEVEVSRVARPPSVGADQMSPFHPKAMVLPSGDQAG